MENSQSLKNGYDMIYLAACALHDRCPDPNTVRSMNLGAVYNLSVRHSMQAITYIALETLQNQDQCFYSESDGSLLKDWKRAKAVAVYKNLMLNDERVKILDFMDKSEIWYLPLKGIILQNYYPKFGMRQMADNDILFDVDGQEILHTFMLKNGYNSTVYKNGPHDVYKKDAVLNFEMHTSLHGEKKRNKVFCEYYKDVKKRLIKDNGNDFGYHFSKEDFYIYFLVHFFRHYASCGSGIRSLMDIYVYNINEKDLNRTYIDGELDKLGIKNFVHTSKLLADKLFSMEMCRQATDLDSLSEKEREILQYCLDSGVYGTKENYVLNNVNKSFEKRNASFLTKSRYLFERIFPSMEYYKNSLPFLYRHKFLIPFFVVYRFFKAIIFKAKIIWHEIRIVFKKHK